MGELFLSTQAKQFRHRRDAALEKELKSRNLFSDCPEIFQTHFRCIPTHRDLVVCAGEQLLARPHPSSNGDIEVIRGHESIAIIQGSGAQLMNRALVQEHLIGGYMPMFVVEQSSLTRNFTARYSDIDQG